MKRNISSLFPAFNILFFTSTMQKRLQLSVFALAFLFPSFLHSQSLSGRARNSVQFTQPLAAVQDPGQLHAGNSRIVVCYTDGLGMPVMTVAPGVTPQGNSLASVTRL